MSSIFLLVYCWCIFHVCCADEICPNVISRRMWGARNALSTDYMKIPVEYVVVIHTVSRECNDEIECSDVAWSIQNYHMESLKFDDIGYNFLVGGDGKVYEGRGWKKMGAHTFGYNKKGVGIALIGDFSKKLPPQKQMDALKNLIECGAKNGHLTKNYKLIAHRQVVATQSPGLKVYQTIQSWPHWVLDP